MRIYKEEKINPAAGCWPVLVQIPVFFALYKVLPNRRIRVKTAFVAAMFTSTLFEIARNVFTGNSEFAGAVFSPDGEVLFVNIQYPGITFAIRGPWSSVRT